MAFPLGQPKIVTAVMDDPFQMLNVQTTELEVVETNPQFVDLAVLAGVRINEERQSLRREIPSRDIYRREVPLHNSQPCGAGLYCHSAVIPGREGAQVL